MTQLPKPYLEIDQRIETLVRQALTEDLGERGDVTTLSLVDPAARIVGVILAREDAVVAGVGVAREVFRQVDERIECVVAHDDGASVKAGTTILRIQGPAQGILTGERTALNFMQRMCGIATMTRRFVKKVSAHKAVILDTRKTTPGLRILEKFAVSCGGGVNHRFGLYDRVMIKDNHRRLWGGGDPERLDLAVEAARKAYPGIAVEVEVENETELRSALRARPEWILLDNMAPEAMERCVAIAAGESRLEASGGITIENVEAAAASGVDAISLGCLTHSAPSCDLSLEICEAGDE